MNGLPTFQIVATPAAFAQVRQLTGLEVDGGLVPGFEADGFGGAAGAARPGTPLYTEAPVWIDGFEAATLENPEAISDLRLFALVADERQHQRDTPEALAAFMAAVQAWVDDPDTPEADTFAAISAVLDDPNSPTVRRAALLPYLWQTGEAEALALWDAQGAQVVASVRTLAGVSLVVEG